MPTTYDVNVLQSSADKLYSRAKGIAFGYAVRGLALGGVLGAVIGRANSQQATMFGGILGVVAAVIGFSMGWEKAFTLRLEAQRTLCALQTEINTRPKQ